MADKFKKFSLLMKGVVAWKRHLYVTSQKRRKSKSIKREIADQHYMSALASKAFKALIKQATPPASGPSSLETGDPIP